MDFSWGLTHIPIRPQENSEVSEHLLRICLKLGLKINEGCLPRPAESPLLNIDSDILRFASDPPAGTTLFKFPYLIVICKLFLVAVM